MIGYVEKSLHAARVLWKAWCEFHRGNFPQSERWLGGNGA